MWRFLLLRAVGNNLSERESSIQLENTTDWSADSYQDHNHILFISFWLDVLSIPTLIFWN